MGTAADNAIKIAINLPYAGWPANQIGIAHYFSCHHILENNRATTARFYVNMPIGFADVTIRRGECKKDITCWTYVARKGHPVHGTRIVLCVDGTRECTFVLVGKSWVIATKEVARAKLIDV